MHVYTVIFLVCKSWNTIFEKSTFPRCRKPLKMIQFKILHIMHGFSLLLSLDCSMSLSQAWLVKKSCLIFYWWLFDGVLYLFITFSLTSCFLRILLIDLDLKGLIFPRWTYSQPRKHNTNKNPYKLRQTKSLDFFNVPVPSILLK